MGPKQRQSANDLILCDMCGCLFVNKDGQTHADLCSQNSPFVIPTTLFPSDDNSYDHLSCPHGLLSDKILFAKVEEFKAKGDISASVMSQCQGRIVQLNPAMMSRVGVAIGGPVIVNRQFVYTAWPCVSVMATAVRLTTEGREEVDHGNGTVTVQALPEPYTNASVLHCNISNIQEICGGDEKSLMEYVLRKLVGRYVASGTELNVDYYGRPTTINVTHVTGCDATSTDTQKLPGTDDPHSISCDMEKLNLSSGSEMSCSTPVKPHSTKLSKLPHFFRICRTTQLVCQDPAKIQPKMSDGIPDLSELGGYKAEIQTIQETITSHLYQGDQLYKQGLRCPGGMLVYGPPGVGKTTIVHAVAASLHVHVTTISGSMIWSKFFGESEAKLEAIFQEAESRQPSIVFLDDLDGICPKRESSKNEQQKRVVATLLTILDRLSSTRSRVFVLGASSNRDDVDTGLRRPGRLDKELELTVPSMADRVEILGCMLCRTDHAISSETMTDIGERAHGYLASDLSALCKEATLYAMKQLGPSTELVLHNQHLVYGLRMVKPSAMKEVSLEVSKVSWSDIGGQEELKLQLRQAVEWPLKHPQAFSRLGIRPPRGLLMYGPPGCSKTMIARALACESGLNFIAIKGPELFSKWVGESERAVREVFRRARAAAPAIVFFDEIDALAGERGSSGGGGGDVSDRVLAQLLTEMDGVQVLEDILVVAATNRPDRIDKALMRPGRLDRIVYVPLPDPTTRQAIFSIHLARMPVSPDVHLQQLVHCTEGYSGAEVSAVCHEAAMAALQEDITTQLILQSHFTLALSTVKPRITPQLLAIYDQYRAQGSHACK